MPRYSLRSLLIITTIACVAFAYLAAARGAIRGHGFGGLASLALAAGAMMACAFSVLVAAAAVFVLVRPQFSRPFKALAAFGLALAALVIGPLNVMVFVRFERIEPVIALSWALVQGFSFAVVVGGLLVVELIARRRENSKHGGESPQI